VLLIACGGSAPPAALEHHAVAPPPRPYIDTDGDRIDDQDDRCPTLAEDFDLHEDADGCPDLDDDGDGVPDLKDMCFDLASTDRSGCPEGCSFIRTISDCFFMTPIWIEATPLSELSRIKAVFVEFPEIELVTLSTALVPTDPPEVAVRRLERARRALIAVGIAADKLEISKDPPRVAVGASADVYGEITKQRFSDGKFRESHCAGGMGTVFRVARDVNYHCKPRICGDGECWHATEDDGSCPQDCPP
jgi:hypothetical protein